MRTLVLLLSIGLPVQAQEVVPEPLEPDLVLGGPSAEGLAAFEFIGGLAVGSGGTIYVLDTRAAEIRAFASRDSRGSRSMANWPGRYRSRSRACGMGP